MTEIYDIYFELSNEDRVNILQTLSRESMNLTRLSSSLGLKNQEVSRHLSRLEEAGLVQKNPKGRYGITSFCNLCLMKNEEMMFLVNHIDYFNSHSLEKTPSDLLLKIGVLSKSIHIDDTLIALQTGKRIIDEAEEYLLRLSDQFMLVLLDHIVAATDRGVRYSFIYSADIQVPPNAGSTVRLRGARDRDLFYSYTHPEVKAFLVMSEKEAIIAFPKLDGKYDYTGFNSTDENVLIWCREFYEHHKADRLPPLPLWDDLPNE